MIPSAREASRRPLSQQFLRLVALLIVMTVVIPLASGQDSPATNADQDGDVFAPFVSRIRIATRDPEVRLTWKDSEDVHGVYKIYRHTSEVNAETFLDAELVAQVEPGVQSFIDAPSEPGEYYYGVLAESAGGVLYEIFIPYRNTTFAPVTVANIATLAERSAHVRGIQVFENNGVVLIKYESDQVGRELMVYRSTSPFTTADDLASAGVVATVMSTVESVIDYPVPGVPYYYGVVDSALVADGSAAFELGVNTTETPVEVPLATVAAEPEPEATAEPVEEAATEPVEEQPEEIASVPTITPEPEEIPVQVEQTVEATTADEVFVPVISRRRPLPLPFLQLNTSLLTGDRLRDVEITVPRRQLISSTTQEALNEMYGRLTPISTNNPGPETLLEDTFPSPRGAEFTLRTILDGPFANLAWENALLQLNNFLSLPLPDDIRSRALFYRAQCFYFTGESERAFVEFLLARENHFAEVETWLDLILSNSAET